MAGKKITKNLDLGYFFDMRSFQLVFSTKRERTSALDLLQ